MIHFKGITGAARLIVGLVAVTAFAAREISLRRSDDRAIGPDLRSLQCDAPWSAKDIGVCVAQIRYSVGEMPVQRRNARVNAECSEYPSFMASSAMLSLPVRS